MSRTFGPRCQGDGCKRLACIAGRGAYCAQHAELKGWYKPGAQAKTEPSVARLRETVALQRLANVLVVKLDPAKENCELLEELAKAAEELLTDAIIRERL